ncbi:MAG TPA: TetR/AcrR family transcriptional regulator [Burkholderiales bacterium]|nr:TetR/AcrR family transcriptional regulator [Burkholderiales bacterium]
MPSALQRASSSVTRRAGRPAVKDAERTRVQILEAAAGEFARSGLGGARVDRIAGQAGVNVRMLYYYFSSKDELFLAVLERAYAIIREAEKALELDRGEPEDAVRRLVRFTWDFQLSHPEFITLLNSENLHGGRHLKKSSVVAELHSPLLDMIGRLLERGARAGVFRGGVDPVQFYITIASLGYFYLSNRHTLSAIFRRDLLAPKQKTTRFAHMIEVVLGYLRPPTPSRGMNTP